MNMNTDMNQDDGSKAISLFFDYNLMNNHDAIENK